MSNQDIDMRTQIERDIQRFLDEGGEIEKVPINCRKRKLQASRCHIEEEASRETISSVVDSLIN